MSRSDKIEQAPQGRPEETGVQPEGRTTGAMHADVPVWSDPCCSCEAEPYWLAVGEETEESGDAGRARGGNGQP
jgi:hypothetical protein